MTVGLSDMSPVNKEPLKFETRAIHVGCEPDVATGAVVPPIYMTTTYAQEAPGVDKGYDYTRAGNPSFTRLEEQLASLEGANYCKVVSSGLAATSAVLGDLVPGDVLLFINSLYGGTHRLLKKILEPKGIITIGVLFSDVNKVDEILRDTPRVKFFMLESPTNPLMEIVDIEKLCSICRKYNVKSLVDNTFATPYHQNPLSLGADVVVHSCTKYIGGHSDVIGGAVMTNDKDIITAVDFQRKCVGYNPSPFDTWLLSRSVKTLAIRVARQSESAMSIASYLTTQSVVKSVYYPGLKSNPNHDVAASQMHHGFGGMVSVEFNLPLHEMKKFISSFKVWTLAESLGAVESLVCHPATMTHASLPADEREKIGLADGLVRFSVGLEAPEDLVSDLSQGLAVVGHKFDFLYSNMKV